MDFRNYLRQKILNPSQRILEFGPLNKPIVTKKTHPNIRFADIRSTADIRKLYTDNDYLEATGVHIDVKDVIDIDYVIKDTYKNTFAKTDKFDVVILSHVIEHMPDIISFFQDIKHIIKRDGRLIIIYPDAKYCFDHFRNGTSFIDAYDVYINKDNSANRVFDFVFNVVHENNASFFWNDQKENKLLPQKKFDKAIAAFHKAAEGELPDDTHFWPFSNYQLIKFIYDMDRAGLLDFDIERFFPTAPDTQECMLILSPKKVASLDHGKYKKIFDEISPSLNDMKAREAIAAKDQMISSLQDEVARLGKELALVYSSKKWKYVNAVAKARSRIIGKNG